MSALDIQIGGEHYKNANIQPVQYIEANGLGFLEGCVVKRITRHDKPTGKGRQDIEKAIHELQLLLELRYPEQTMDALSYGTALHQAMTARTNPPVEDIYAEFAARTKALPKNPNAKMRLCCMSFDDRPHDYQCSADIHTGKMAEFAARVGTVPGYELLIKCEECKVVSRGGRTHAATCSQLTAPEEYKAEAQVAFDEAAGIADALARQVSAGKIDIGFDWGSAVAEEEALLEAGEEPAAAMNDDSPRMQSIGQNGEMGPEVYKAIDDPFAGAPEWAKYKAQDADGECYWYACRPVAQVKLGYWVVSKGHIDAGSSGGPNPDWRDTLITRT